MDDARDIRTKELIRAREMREMARHCLDPEMSNAMRRMSDAIFERLRFGRTDAAPGGKTDR